MPLTRSHLDRAVAVQLVFSVIRNDLHLPFNPVQALVLRITTLGTVRMSSKNGRGVANLPILATRPESGHGLLRSLRIGKHHIHLDFQEWIAPTLFRLEGNLNHSIGLRVDRRGLRGQTPREAAQKNKVYRITLHEKNLFKLIG